MPTLAANGAELYYEITGEGPPLVLITGLGFGIWSWYRQIPALSEQHTVIALDNRGIGRSSAPPGPFSIADMAEDVAALIRHLGAHHGLGGRAHVLGLSMGGFVAQELVLAHPELVDRLILACTSAGRGYSVPASSATVATIMAEVDAGFADDILARGAHLRFSDRFTQEHPEALAELIERRRDKLPPRELWDRQVAAAMGFSTGERLSSVRAPTLVITGDDDPIVPPANADILAQGIPGARLCVIPGGRHLFFIEFAERFNREVVTFLAAG